MSGITEEIRRQALAAAGEKVIALLVECVVLPQAQCKSDHPAIVELAKVVLDGGEDWDAAQAAIRELCGPSEKICTAYKFSTAYKARRGRGARPEKCPTCEGTRIVHIVEYMGLKGVEYVDGPMPVDAKIQPTPCRCPAGRRLEAEMGLDHVVAERRFQHRLTVGQALALEQRCWELWDESLGRKRPTFNTQPRNTVAIKLEL